MKKLIIFAILLLTTFTFGQEKYAGRKLIGYVPTWCSGLPTYDNEESINKIDFSKLTHAIVAFINSDENGNLVFPGMTASPWTHEEALDTIIARSKRNNTKVLISLGSDINGWNMTLSEDARANFAKNIKQYMIDKNIDGLDLDLEGGWDVSAPFYRDEYTLLAKELRDTLGNDFYLTAAIGALETAWTGDSLWTDEFISVLDWVNIMVYDLHMWDANDVRNHSGFSDQVAAARTWEKRISSKEKLVFGVPFYANGWDSDNKKRYEIEINWWHNSNDTDSSKWTWNKTGLSTNYFILDSLFDLSPDTDSILVTQDDKIWLDAENSTMGFRGTHNGIIYFNGQMTLKNKAKWAIDSGYGGIMIWEATGDIDANHPNSLLSALAAQFEESTKDLDEFVVINSKNKAFLQNNFSVLLQNRKLNISLANESLSKIKIIDSKGKILYQTNQNNKNISINLSKKQFSNGIYFLQILQNGNIKSAKFLVK